MLIGLLVVGLLFVGFATVKYFTVKPPTAEINSARESIAKAKNAHAGKYASERLRHAEKMFNEAMVEWSVENGKFVAFRDFSRVRDLANSALNISTNAFSEAGSVKDKYTRQLDIEMQKTEAQINRFENYYKNLPVGRVNFDRYHKAKIQYLEAQHEYTNKNYQKAMELIAQASENLGQAEKASRAKLHSFYEDFPDWERDIQKAFQLSKRQTVVLVNKMNASCSVLKGGKEIKVFEAEFGPNWLGDKKMRGDRATPQGVYKVTEKKKAGRTKYYKALLLNYPNNEDLIRFDRLKKAGSVSKGAHIGGLIEIHGHGGKGVHWTDGCVALRDKDMDSIYELCAIGTPVFIIGSDKTLAEYLNELP